MLTEQGGQGNVQKKKSKKELKCSEDVLRELKGVELGTKNTL